MPCGARIALAHVTVCVLEFIFVFTLHLTRPQEKFTEAIPLLERAFKIRVKKLGEKHPDTVSSLKSLTTVRARVSAQLGRPSCWRAQYVHQSQEDMTFYFFFFVWHKNRCEDSRDGRKGMLENESTWGIALAFEIL